MRHIFIFRDRGETEMKQFREDNTEGFSTEELDIMNAVFSRLQNWFPGIDQKNIADAINNNWEVGISEDDLYRRLASSFAGLWNDC